MGIKDLMGLKDNMVSGIKDLLGKGEKAKKQEEYREALKGAVMDGKLSNTDIRDLEALRQELEVDPANADKTEVRREIYNEAFDAAKQEGVISATGMHELSKIQKFLGLRDDQIEKTKFQVTRLRTLTEIKNGNLPVVPDTSVALRDVALEAGEVAHYTMSVDILDKPNTRGADGVAIVPGQPYAPNTAAGHVLPEENAKQMGEATLILTSRRVLLKTRGRVAQMKLADAKLFLYGDGLRLARNPGNTLLRFKSRSDETAEIVGALLSAVMK